MKQPISMIRGTTQPINIIVRDPAGAIYQLTDGEVLRFGMKKKPEDPESECLVKKELTIEHLDGDFYVLTLLPSDTKDLPFGTYYYDVGLQSGNNYYNVIECSEFKIGYNITLPEVTS